MEVKKAIKKVAALGTSAAFMATAISGAFAASLADYPGPFVKDGQFDAMIVVGKNALADDVLGAVDVGVGLQFAMKKEKTVSTGAPTATTSSGIKIEKTGNHLNLGRTLNDVQDTSLSETDLPDLLADGNFRDNEGDNFNEETYTQRIFLVNQSGDLTRGNFFFDQPSNPVERDAGTYVYFDNANDRPIYRYELEFDTAIDYNNATSADVRDDLEDNVIEIEGADYTIAKAEGTGSANRLDKITLFSGETVLWLQQNQPIEKTINGVDHTVEVFDVTEDADSCGVNVDGSVVWVDVDTTEIINGVEVGVTDAKVVHAQLQDVDVCQVNIGASKVEIRNNEKVKKDGKDVDGSRAFIRHENSVSGKWQGFNVTYAPKKDVYLAPGEAWTDAIFSGFKIQYAGNTAVTENISIKTAGSSSVELRFLNNDGKEVMVPFTTTSNSWVDTNGVIPGSDWDEIMLWENGQQVEDPNGVEGTWLFVVTAGKEAHVLQIADVDTTDNETDIDDLTYGRTYNDKDVTFGSNTAIDLSGIGTITLNFAGSGKNLTANTIRLGSYAATMYDANLTFDTNSTLTNFSIDTTNQRTQYANSTGTKSNIDSSTVATIDLNEKDQPSSEDANTVWRTTINVDTSSDEIDLAQPTNVSGQDARHIIQFRNIAEDNNDVQVAMSFHGTKTTYDADEGNYAIFEYPEDQLFGNVFVTPITATVTSTGGAIKTIDLQKINVGAARFDTEILEAGKISDNNLIVIGGPCVNKVAADLQGVTFAGSDCTAGYTDGEGILKLYDTGAGKVALLVAGFKGQDTRAASRVLGNYGAYAAQLKGSEVKVTYTSLSSITVSSPQ